MIHFTKMHGLGNDYIYVNTDEYPIENPEEAAIRWSRYHTGIGSDGLVLISRSEVADFKMRIFNADGSEAMMCGNASRCIGKYVYEKGLTEKTEVTLETLSGIKTLRVHLAGKTGSAISGGSEICSAAEPQLVDSVTVNMGGYRHEPIAVQGYTGTAVNVGNPHVVIFVKDIEKIDVAKDGYAIEHDAMFPDRTNVEFVQVIGDGQLRMRVWERGSGITQACGTGACATAVAATILMNGVNGDATLNGVNGEWHIVMDGGALDIEVKEGQILMTGPAAFVFEGEVE